MILLFRNAKLTRKGDDFVIFEKKKASPLESLFQKLLYYFLTFII